MSHASGPSSTQAPDPIEASGRTEVPAHQSTARGKTAPAPQLPLAQPDLTALEEKRVLEAVRSGRLAFGPQLEAFEDKMAARCETDHAVATSSGTAALHLIVRALGLGAGDEVVTTPYSFVASSNALLFEDVRPRFVDIDPTSFNLDPGRVEDAITADTRALLAVDVFGRPADWPALTALAESHDLLLIDDACEALGARVGGRAVGSWAAAAAFGFYPNKQITTGEGGCLTTDDAELAARCRSLRNQGRASRSEMAHVRLGYNYRLSELQAALGAAQLERLDDLLGQRARVASLYQDALAPLHRDGALRLPNPPGAAPPDETDRGADPGTDHGPERSWFVYVVRLADHFAPGARDELIERLRERNIGCAPYFPSIHLQPYYRDRFGFENGDFPVCEATSARTIALPFFTEMTADDTARVADALDAALSALPRTRAGAVGRLPTEN
jgi:perosamine synthetase